MIKFIILILLLSSLAFAQEDEKPKDPFEVIELETYTLSDSDIVQRVGETEAKLNHGVFITIRDWNYAYIAVRLKDKLWHEFEVGYDASTIKIEQSVYPAMLIIRGEKPLYGTGGGTNEYGITIVNYDSVITKVFDFWYGSSEESFGRETNGEDGYTHYCGQEVEVNNDKLIIAPAKGEADKTYRNDHYIDICDNILKPGIYQWKEEKYKFSESFSTKRRKKRK
jgi:hypothetical protein